MSDNDLDAELLALAGDESGEEDEAPEQEEAVETLEVERSKSFSPPAVAVASPSPEPQSPEPERPQSPPRRGVAQRVPTKVKVGAKKRARKDESEEEEGEASSPASVNTLGSEAMSESSSDTPQAAVTGDVGTLFPIEGKYHSAQDKAEILGMSEIQREAILAERAQQVERHNQDVQLRRLLQVRGREEAKAADKRKRKATSAELDDSQRKSSRLKTKSNEPLEAYKRQRAQRAQRDEDRRNGRRSSRDRSSASSRRSRSRSDADADGESEVEWDTGAKSTAPVETPAGTLRTFNKTRISRSNFAQACFWPQFDDTIRGCFTRLLTRCENGEQIYRMVRIKGFTEGKPYEMMWKNRRFMTDQYMIVAYGKETMEREFVCASESEFTEDEFNRYKRICEAHGIALPKEPELHAKLLAINAMLDRGWSNEDINAKIERQNKYADRVKAKLQAMAANAEAQKASQGPTQAERLEQLNKENRRANARDVRLAQLAEKQKRRQFQEQAAARHRQQMAEDAAAKAAAAEAAALAVDSGDDLFGDGGVKSRSATPAAVGTPKPPAEKKKLAVPTPRSGGIGGFKTLKTKTMDEEIMENLDFGIEIDI